MKKRLFDLVSNLVSKRTQWRLGRALYMKARSDVENNMNTNGETGVQRCVIKNAANNNDLVVVLDIGANIGNWTISLLREASRLSVESRIRMHSFEPVPKTFDSLKSRINKHVMLDETVTAINKGLSNRVGTADIYVVADNAGTNSLFQDPSNAETRRVEIEQITVDKYCMDNGIERVDFVKCDTEGNDMNVLLGMDNLMKTERVMVIQFEYNHRWIFSRHYLKDAFDWIEGRPFSLGKVTQNGLELYSDWHPELERFFEGNYLIVHDSALSWFNVKKGRFDSHNTYDISD
jgi:FkbM family methyltransferase